MIKQLILIALLVLAIIGLVGCSDGNVAIQNPSDDNSDETVPTENVSDDLNNQLASDDDVEIGEMV